MKRTHNRTPGVIAHSAPGAIKKRVQDLRLKRLQLAKSAGFESADKLSGALFDALKSGPQTGWYMLESPQPCQRCGESTEVANQYSVKGWILLQPICINCSAHRGA